MAVTFLITVITGFVEPHINPGDSGHHIVFAILFLLLAVIHFVLNYRVFLPYFSVSSKKAAAK